MRIRNLQPVQASLALTISRVMFLRVKRSVYNLCLDQRVLSMKHLLHVIHVEDSVEDSDLVRHLLQASGLHCEIQLIQTREQLVEALEQSKCDLILSDCTLPNFHGLEALQIARASKPNIPFIFVS